VAVKVNEGFRLGLLAGGGPAARARSREPGAKSHQIAATRK
jgi:hypothetical protein